jgi:hypothetical protein
MTILQSAIAQSAAGATGYQIARSLRFNSADGAYLNRTFSTPTNQKKWTWSGWIKRSSLNSNGTILFSTGGSGGAQTYITYGGAITTGTTADGLNLFGAPSGDNINVYGNAVYRDLSAFANVVFSVDTTQATAANRVRIYVNGIEISYATSTYPTLNQDLKINSAYSHAIGATTSLDSWSYFNAYVADILFIDGQQLTPSSFGEFDANTGVWNPIAYTGTYGTNGFKLTFSDNSNTTAATLGKDSSGNSNNWTPNNFSVTAGAGNDSLVDTPTNYGTDTGVGGEVRGNYATLTPLTGTSKGTFSNGNLDFTSNATNWAAVLSTTAISSGKWYWEVIPQNSLEQMHGILASDTNMTLYGGGISWIGQYAKGYSYQNLTGNKYNNNVSSAYGATYTTNDVIGVALNLDAGTLTFYKNGTTQGVAYSSLTGEFYPAFSLTNNAGANSAVVNFGQRPFAYTAPSGFKALCTQNLPSPAIGATSSTLANKNFDIATYTGTGSSLSVTSLAFQPDFTWIKGRSGATDHALYDAVRGVQLDLASNTTAVEATQAQGVTAFGSTGFTVGTLAKLNTSSATYAAWNWKANGAGSSNTSGTITSTVSANSTAGISIVKYTGNGSNGATVGHGLGVAPKMIIVKSRNYGPATNWNVYHQSIGAANTLYLNSTAASASNATAFNSTTPGSSVFTLGTNAELNNNTFNYVAYCFAEVAGFSKFGTYTGNGSADGTFVYTGFMPRYVCIKQTSGAGGSWELFDTARNTYNVADLLLEPNSSGAQSTAAGYVLDFLSNGIKLRGTASGINASGATYIFMAFAESPFNYARAR